MKKLTHEEFVEKLLLKNQHFANGEFELVSKYTHSHNKIDCKCNKCGNEWSMCPTSLLNGYGCHLCRLNSWRISQEEFLKRLKSVHNNIIALDKYIDMDTKVRFQCQHGHVWFAEPHNVLRGSGCPYCSDKAVWVGYNDLWTTRPDIARLLANPEDGYKYTKSSHSKVEFKCPDCGSITKLKINEVYNRGFSCSRCSDGISYPNKFARCFLDQLPIDNYIYEYSPEWIKPYRYDGYFEYNENKYIVEMDGGFHFKESGYFDKIFDEIKLIDKIKTELAIQNGIKIIRINCLKSECDYIKNNILSSELSAIFNLSTIDWDLCDKMAQKNLVKQACDLYMSGITRLRDIASILRIDRTTVHRYVKTGAKFGWCNYDSETAKKEAVLYSSVPIPIVIVDNELKVLYHFRSIHNCQKQLKEIYNIGTTRDSIVDACRTHKPYKGFNFRFANEFEQTTNNP